MTLKLYHCPETRSMRSLWLLHELGIPFAVENMPFDHKILRAPEYLAVHPLGRIPALVDGDVKLFESGAIAEYLCERYDSAKILDRPLGHPERYHWLQWIHFAETIIIPCQNLVQQYVFVLPEDRSETVIYFETRRIGKCLDALEKILKGQDYILPSGFSAADTSLGFSVYFSTAFISLGEHPAVKGYYDRIVQRPAFQKSQPPSQAEPMAWLKPRLGPIRNPNTGKVIA